MFFEEISDGRLFIESSEINKSCGKALWNAVMIEAKHCGRRYLTWKGDPNAAGFYLKMGAKQIGVGGIEICAWKNVTDFEVLFVK